ncbi:DciA family protein [Methyloligella sp. 2.7D]|uniref:DUF721 domain-containing protein n=1 Tax=unclassified Methyloligella TaxID=2625955 RepID=UPI00157D5C72|nr:DciA family protein [Methyloligella sp. GL2]QKP78309.1 DUF721 domain-containing protein [Methyloligella sp. GL2]
MTDGSGDNRAPGGRRGSSAKPIAALVAKTLAPAARARGFTTMALLRDWPTIAGAELAQFTKPEKVNWPRSRQSDVEDAKRRSKRPEGATLILRVDGPRALEVQYQAQQLMERVNRYFGYRAVVEMRLLQAPVTPRTPEPRPAPPPLDPETVPKDAKIESQDLRDALVRLGSAVRAKKSQNSAA